MNNDGAVSAGSARRPLKVRQKRWAIVSAAWLARRGVEPRWISISSFVFALFGSGAFFADPVVYSWIGRSLLLVFAAAMMQLRLVCNLLDGMVAVEGNRRTPDGELYNDLPDRFSDWILFVATGYATATTAGITAGWIAAMLAVMTAYVRVLGRSCGAETHFAGPMAKQQRMAVLSAACVVAALCTPWHWEGRVLLLALILVSAGSLLTVIRRLLLIAGDLRRMRA